LVAYYQAEPAVGLFSVLDLPDLKEKVVAAVEQVRAVDDPFSSLAQQIVEIMSGTLGKILSLTVVAVGLAMAVAKQSLMSLIAPLSIVLPIQFMPGIISTVTGVPLSSESKSIKVESNGGKFVRQLVDEKRYAELAIAAGELMPAGQAAYVRSQIAYLEQKPDVAKVELGKISGKAKGIKAERLAVMEKFAFGSAKSPAAVKYVQDAQESMSVRNTVHQSVGGVGHDSGAGGGCNPWLGADPGTARSTADEDAVLQWGR